MYVCVWVCLFVCYKKGSITFDPNNTTFTQKIDDCMGRVINFIRRKTVTIWNVLSCYEKLHFVYRQLAVAAQSASLL